MYNARILADSYAHGVRLTTFEVTYPRFIHSEVMTHRTLSRNTASSRAVPTEKFLHEVKASPVVPEFNHRVKGMGVGEPLGPEGQRQAREAWLTDRDDAVRAVERLSELDVDKSRANRLLEPFLWHTALLTGTEWGNFFALRTQADAQPEFRRLALLMQEAYRTSIPWHCADACWHLPLCSLDEMGDPIDYHYWKMVSTGRCARVSYLTHDGKRDTTKDVGLHNRLLADRHLSPLEHVARPFYPSEWEIVRELQEDLRQYFAKRNPEMVEIWCRQLEYCGNLRGWHGYRADIPNEHDYSLISAA